MDRNLALEVVRVTEAAALAAGRLMGRGDVAAADRAAGEAMRRAFSSIALSGTVVIGEGTPAECDLLYVGERVGNMNGPEIDVALDPLEGPTICATGGDNALAIIAVGEPGAFLRCPETQMDKIVAGAEARGVIDLDRSPTDNLRALAEAKGVYVADLTVAILDRPRHEKLINELRRAGARVKLLNDGDVGPAIATSRPDAGVDMLMGVGGAPQGILTAAAIRCAGGFMEARIRPRNLEEAERVRTSGITDIDRKLAADDMASGSVMFAATGVTNGDYLRGVRYVRGGAVSNSVVMRSRTRTVRFLESTHRFDLKPEY